MFPLFRVCLLVSSHIGVRAARVCRRRRRSSEPPRAGRPIATRTRRRPAARAAAAARKSAQGASSRCSFVVQRIT
eukprot:COSAG02_NODE_509_length_20882_cov_71.811914_4_plen_75_part_00